MVTIRGGAHHTIPRNQSEHSTHMCWRHAKCGGGPAGDRRRRALLIAGRSMQGRRRPGSELQASSLVSPENETAQQPDLCRMDARARARH